MQKIGLNRSTVAAAAAFLAIFLYGMSAENGAAEELSRYEASHRAMGSVFTIVLYAEDDKSARAGFEAAFRRIVELDDTLSDYDPRSELSRLSAASPTEDAVPVGDDLWRVLHESKRFHDVSGGAFDVTVGPLTTLWRRARRTKELPSDEQLQKALDAVGFQHVELVEDKQAVLLKRAGMRLDLGGIAKGLAVDEALAELRQQNIDSALVNGGGDIAASAAPPGRDGWKIGVAPLAPGAKPSIFLLLEHQAVATSGDAWQYVEIAGKRYSHIVDPETGLGLSSRSSVTVVAEDCTSADALASSVSVLGPVKGLELIDSWDDAEALVIREIDGEIELQKSAGFDELPKAK